MSESVIDIPTFNGLREVGDADFINELIDTFLEDAPHMLNELRQSLEENNAERFRRTAHSLKSNSNTFGALVLADLAKELELIGRDNQLDRVDDKLQELSTEYARVETALRGIRNA
jgi:HPt (histidine-containing phosphotransfer) domain-containing protein